MVRSLRNTSLAALCLVLGGLVLGGSVLGACTPTPRTQIMLIVDADPTVRVWATSLELDVAGRAASVGSFEPPEHSTESPTWPLEVAIVPLGNDASRVIRVAARASDGSGRALSSVVETSFVPGETRALHVFLSADCEGVDCARETCRRGVCSPIAVPGSALLTYGTDGGPTIDAGGIDTPVLLDAPADTPDTHLPDAPCIPPALRVDMLILMDTSASMREEQDLIRAGIPELVRALRSGDVDGDGMPDYSPVVDLQVGLITPDLGVGLADALGCTRTGDMAVLRSTSIASSCTGTYGPIVRFTSGGDPTAAAAALACLANAGAMGCGFEQQFDAVLEAASPDGATSYTRASYIPLAFADGSMGRAETDNAGLFRDDAVLAIVLITDEDDCTALDPRSFFDLTTLGLDGPNLRCATMPDRLHPVSRFVDGILQMRQIPQRIVFVPITGIPVARSPGVRVIPDFDAILADPSMTPTPLPSMPARLSDVCTNLATGGATPAPRIVTAARDLAAAGVHTTVQSICADNYQTIIRAIAYRVGLATTGTCTP